MLNNISQHLSELADKSGDSLAIAIQKANPANYRYTEISFQQLDELSDSIAKGLLSIGVTAGTRTLLMVPPSVEFFVF